jgi:beta-glucosidase
MHRKFLREIVKRQPDLVFIGDSITAEWLTTGYPFWKAAFEPRRAFNLGIPGDSTQGVLWRIENGELDGIKPRAVVLLIGTNNIPQHEAPDEIARGIVACVHAIRAKLPAADVVLLGILPRGPNPSDPLRVAAQAVHASLATTAFGPSVTYLDVSSIFVQPDGPLTPGFYVDELHLTLAGYRAWARAIDSTLQALVG